MTGTPHLIAGTVTAAASCLASAAITTVVAIEAPAETADALVTSFLVVVLGLWRARQIAAPKERAVVLTSDSGGEPTIYRDPMQRRMDQVLSMVREGRITAEAGERLIDNLRTHPLERDVPVPPYGTPGGQP